MAKPKKKVNVSKKPKGAQFSLAQLLAQPLGLNRVQKQRLMKAGLLDERRMITNTPLGKMNSKQKASLKDQGLLNARQQYMMRGNKKYAQQVKDSKNPAKNINAYLKTDSDYLRTTSNLKKNLDTAGIRFGQQDKDLVHDYNLTKGRLEQEKGFAGKDLGNQNAAQGLYGSGLYAAASNRLNNSYAQQFNDASSSYQRSKRGIQDNWQDTKRLYGQNVGEAKAQAIRRRAAKYGITK